MSCVVFLRGVNVGKHHRFQPSILAKELHGLEVVNVGAAGTFVVRTKIPAARLRAQILERLSFTPEIMIYPAHDIVQLVPPALSAEESTAGNVRIFVTATAKAPAVPANLPLFAPEKALWEVKIVRISGSLVLSLSRPVRKQSLYPNDVIERNLGVAGTTRSWNTIEKILKILQA
jgi:uncharacterized protein (DUF1697 family)